jgi:capsid protein
MPILDANGYPVTSGRRHFHNSAAQDRGVPTEPIFTDDWDKLVPEYDRKVILSHSRKMFANYGPARGALIQVSDNVVGRAWNPVFTGIEREWGKRVTAWLEEQWFELNDVHGTAWDFKTNLWLDCISALRDGDIFVILRPSSTGYPLTQRISANRVASRNSYQQLLTEGPYRGRRMSHGIVMNEDNQPIAYHILGDNPEDDTFVPARDVIHIMSPTWHDQTRGEPVLAHALKFIRSSLLSHEWEQMAQLMVSNIGLVETNEVGGPSGDDWVHPSIDENGDAGSSPVIESLHGGTIRYIRSGSGGSIQQIKQERPSDMWDTFQDRVVRIACSGVPWPYELVWKSERVNAAMVRDIQNRARKTVEDMQDTLRRPALRMVRWAVARAVKAGILDAPADPRDLWHWDFRMPAKFSIDPGRDAMQRREDYKIGLTNKKKIVEEEGGDPEQVDDDRINEVFDLELKIRAREAETGMTIDRRLFYMLSPNDQPISDDNNSNDDEE